MGYSKLLWLMPLLTKLSICLAIVVPFCSSFVFIYQEMRCMIPLAVEDKGEDIFSAFVRISEIRALTWINTVLLLLLLPLKWYESKQDLLNFLRIILDVRYGVRSFYVRSVRVQRLCLWLRNVNYLSRELTSYFLVVYSPTNN